MSMNISVYLDPCFPLFVISFPDKFRDWSWSRTRSTSFVQFCSYLIFLNPDLFLLSLPVTCICSAHCQESGFIWIISLSLSLPCSHAICSSHILGCLILFILQVSSSFLHLQKFNSFCYNSCATHYQELCKPHTSLCLIVSWESANFLNCITLSVPWSVFDVSL